MEFSQPILLIDIINENNQQKFRLTEQAEDLLMSLSSKIISVIGIAGPQRTGKSFLCNTLINKMDGFQIGNSTLPCTKGIWIWGQPLIIDDQAIIIVDTEGLHSVFRDKQLDSIILGITLLLCSVFVYNNFGVIDEKQLGELAAVIEMTKWVKDGNVIPYFLWCLRDFVLDTKGYDDSDDYMEHVLSTKDYDVKSDKYKMRKSFLEFFKERGCLFFVRPLNDEKKIREIEKQDFEDLRPEFREAVDVFKQRVHHFLKPKRYNNKVLNGATFCMLIKEILDSFNNKRVPEIKSSIERVLQMEKRELVSYMKKFIDKFFIDQINEDNFVEKGVKAIIKIVEDECKKKQNSEIAGELVSELIKYFFEKLKKEKKGLFSKKLNEMNEDLESLIFQSEEKIENYTEKLTEIIEKHKLTNKEVPMDFLKKKIIDRIIKKFLIENNKIKESFKNELEEKEKDIEAEKIKKDNLNSHMEEQKQRVSEYTKKIEHYQNMLKLKNEEISDLREINNNEKALLNQLSSYKEKILELEKQTQDLKKGKKYSVNNLRQSIMNESVLDQINGGNMTKDVSENLKAYFDYLKDEVLKENDFYIKKVDMLELENNELKLEIVETAEKDKKIERLQTDLKKARSINTDANQLSQETALYIAENRRLTAEKMNFHYVIKEVIKAAKKKKAKVKNALSLLNDEDEQEVIKILKELKVKF